MAYGNRRFGGNQQKGKGVRLTGLFKTKRNGLYVGTIAEDKIDELIDLIKKAKKADKEITTFVWKSDKEVGPRFSLVVDIAQDRNERGKPKRRPIEDDDDDDEPQDEPAEDTSDDDEDPFGDD